MKIKLDENLPKIPHLRFAQEIEVDTVLDEGLAGASDMSVFSAAQAEHRLLVTQDLDFSDIRRFGPGTHQSIILFRLGNPSLESLIDRVIEILTLDDLQTWQGCFVVVTESKVRVHRP